MSLLQDGHPDHPDCVVWRILDNKTTYLMVQICNGKKKKTPAWEKFIKFMNSADAGESPGSVPLFLFASFSSLSFLFTLWARSCELVVSWQIF